MIEINISPYTSFECKINSVCLSSISLLKGNFQSNCYWAVTVDAPTNWVEYIHGDTSIANTM